MFECLDHQSAQKDTLLKGALKAKALSNFHTSYKLFNNSICTFSTDINYSPENGPPKPNLPNSCPF